MASKYDDRMAQTHERLENAVSDGPLTERDKGLITQFIDHQKANNRTQGTIYVNVDHLVRFAERAGSSLCELTERDIQETLDAMGSGSHPDVKDDGIGLKNYQNPLRLFYEFHADLGVRKDSIDLDQPDGRSLEPEDLLYEEEVDALLNACQRANIRDMAFVALTLATGQRIDAIRTLRLKHVKDEGRTMEIQLNTEEGALKGASGSKPLLWAKHYVRPWVRSHPHKGNPDAALFCPNTAQGNGASPDPTEPMHQETFRKNLHRRAEDAGIEKRVYPHLLRHCAITRMVQEGLTEQQIKQIVGWNLDSSQFSTYANLADELSNDSIREQLGMPTTGEKTWVGRPSLNQCPECGDMTGDAERCPTCQTAFTHKEAQEGEPGRSQDPEEIVANMDDEEKLELIDALRDELRG